MPLRIRLLGTLLIEDQQVTPSEIMKWSKGCAMLAYLVVTNEVQSRETVADLLWDATSTAQSLQNLRKLLSRMRRWAPALTVTRKQVTYPAASTDHYMLTTALASGGIQALDGALSLYKGELLEGFFLDDAPRFNEWLFVEREHLRRRVIAAYRRICIDYAEQELWPQGIAAAQRWVELDALDEQALRHLLKLLAASGQVEVALRQYETSRERLWAELGVEPEPETVQLGRRLAALKAETGGGLAWDAVVQAQPDQPQPGQLAEPGPLPPNAYLPHRRNDDFAGRKDPLLELTELLLPRLDEEPQPRAVAVTGIGGVGKTQLAVEFAYRYGRFFPGGVYWMSFADAESVAGEVAAVGGEQGMALYREAERLTQADKVGRVRRAWQETIPRLLIFDNCEEEALLADWLPVTGGCRVLLTSRRALWSRELQVVACPLMELESNESVYLLQRLVPDLAKSEAGEIASEVGHLPLALHMAGGFLRRYRQVSAARYLAQLRDKGLLRHPSLRGHGLNYSPTGHELHVSRTFAISLAQLDPVDGIDDVARKLLARAACFAPGEPIPQSLLLDTVTNDKENLEAVMLAEDGIMELKAHGFLEERESGIVVMHRLLVAFANHLIKDNEARSAVEEGMVLRLIHRLEQNRFSGILPFSLAHLRHVTNRALAGTSARAAPLATILGEYLREIGEYDAAKQILENAIAAAQKTKDAWVRGVAGVTLTRVLESQGYNEAALQTARRAEAWVRQTSPPDPVWLTEILLRKGWILFWLGQAAPARASAREGQIISEGADLKHALADSLNLQGVIAYYLSAEYDVAAHLLEQALALCQKVGDRFGEGTVLSNLGENARIQGDYKKAAAYYQESLDIALKIGNRARELIFRHNLATVQVALGEFQNAAETFVELIAQGPREWRVLSEAYCSLAEAYLGQRKTQMALEAAQRALEHGRTSNNPHDIGHAWRVLARVAEKCGPIEVRDLARTSSNAPACYAQSLGIFKKANLDRERALVLWHWWAEYELSQGNSYKGQQMWQEAREAFVRLNLPLLVGRMDDSNVGL